MDDLLDRLAAKIAAHLAKGSLSFTGPEAGPDPAPVPVYSYPQITSPQSGKVFPAGAAIAGTISSNLAGNYTVTLTSVNGSTTVTVNVVAAATDYPFSFGTVAAGEYLIKVQKTNPTEFDSSHSIRITAQ